MFDFHLHSSLSYDSQASAQDMVAAAQKAGLREICFTEHRDYLHCQPRESTTYRLEDYHRVLDTLEVPGIVIRHGFEIGLTPWNAVEVDADLKARHYDFVMGSVHFINDEDPYMPPYWEGKTVQQAETAYFEEMLQCVQVHDDFDVLGHLTYIGKTPPNPSPRLAPLDSYREIVTEIMKILVAKGKGLEVNTSGVDRCGGYLPEKEYLQLFRELGGEIVTVGSDAHAPDRVGQYTGNACALVQEVFGYVCTFADRKPVFHRI